MRDVCTWRSGRAGGEGRRDVGWIFRGGVDVQGPHSLSLLSGPFQTWASSYNLCPRCILLAIHDGFPCLAYDSKCAHSD